MARINRAERIRRKNKARFMKNHPIKAGVRYIKWNTKSKSNITALTRQKLVHMYIKDGLKWRKINLSNFQPIKQAFSCNHPRNETYGVIYRFLKAKGLNPYDVL